MHVAHHNQTADRESATIQTTRIHQGERLPLTQHEKAAQRVQGAIQMMRALQGVLHRHRRAQIHLDGSQRMSDMILMLRARQDALPTRN